MGWLMVDYITAKLTPKEGKLKKDKVSEFLYDKLWKEQGVSIVESYEELEAILRFLERLGHIKIIDGEYIIPTEKAKETAKEIDFERTHQEQAVLKIPPLLDEYYRRICRAILDAREGRVFLRLLRKYSFAVEEIVKSLEEQGIWNSHLSEIKAEVKDLPDSIVDLDITDEKGNSGWDMLRKVEEYFERKLPLPYIQTNFPHFLQEYNKTKEDMKEIRKILEEKSASGRNTEFNIREKESEKPATKVKVS
jgi:hypothetical protein